MSYKFSFLIHIYSYINQLFLNSKIINPSFQAGS